MTAHRSPPHDRSPPPWFTEAVRDLPVGLEAAEPTIRARLKRFVVERCIYGVDLDPLAVELGRLSLWIETMDRDLPFGFLDHKLKCGNALVGCWFDRFQEFPALCLHRPQDDAGDKQHTTALHHPQGSLSARLKTFRNEELKPALARAIEARDPGVFAFLRDNQSPAGLHAVALDLFEQMHALPVHETEERARFYRDRIEGDPQFQQLREAFDTWCALWFWPVDQLEHFPLPSELRRPTEPDALQDRAPSLFTAPSPEARAIIRQLRDRHRFFHWELEFPDVFSTANGGAGLVNGEQRTVNSGAGLVNGEQRTVNGPPPQDRSPSFPGFAAMLGNPPWEVQKPNSKEWFSNHDPLYRTYGKQEALRRQKDLFALAAGVEGAWLDYCARFKALSNWCANAAFPWGDPQDDAAGFPLAKGRLNAELHALWRIRRARHPGYADPQHPFRHQGSADLNTYKLFLEQNHALLQTGGRMGVIVPSNIYTDKGSTSLRTLFLDRCRWEWLFGFENRERIFDIDSRFKFCPLILQKSGRTTAIRTAFMRRNLADWEVAERHSLLYPRAQVDQFSPRSRAILELRSDRDVAILEKMYRNGVLLGDDSPRGWGLQYACEFHMTNDSKLFPPRPWWEDRGYAPDEYGHWLKGNWRPITDFTPNLANWGYQRGPVGWPILHRPQGLILSRNGTQAIHADDIEDVALPLYEGRMIDHFDFSAKGWVSGKGRSAVWRDIPWEAKVIEPQFLMQRKHFLQAPYRVGFMDIASATNSRTMISTFLPCLPCGNKVPVLSVEDRNAVSEALLLALVLNSFAFDGHLRQRLGGLTINYFIIEEAVLPCVERLRSAPIDFLPRSSLGLCGPSRQFATEWQMLSTKTQRTGWHQAWALTDSERARLTAMSNAAVALSYGLDTDDLQALFHDCHIRGAALRSDQFTRTLDPKGFWRVDKEKDPELRHTVLSLVAFHDLERMGLEAFLAQNDGEGWMLPDTLRLADYGLGHDDRAREPQPVASRLGPRFYPWQLEGTVEESWEECRRHAENLRLIRAHGGPEEANSERSTVNGASENSERRTVNGGLVSSDASASAQAGAHPGHPSAPSEVDLFGNPIRPRHPKR